MKVLALIPARGGSKRVPDKNIRDFLGKPLIAYTIEQAKACSFVDRVIVDTDSEKIATVAKSLGADVPWLRPARLATDFAKVIDSILYNIKQLEQEENYVPTHIMLLQTTTPLRLLSDIEASWELMKQGGADSVVTVFPSNPRPGDLLAVEDGNVRRDRLVFKDGQVMGYNGFVYIMEREALLREKKIITEKTKVFECPQWRSVDIDTFEDWALAEFLYKNREAISDRIENLVK